MLDGSNSPQPTALYDLRGGGRICQAVIFPLFAQASRRRPRGLASLAQTKRTGRKPVLTGRSGQIVRPISDPSPPLCAPKGGATSARRAFRAGRQKPSSRVWRAERRAGAMPTPARSENRTQNHDAREVPVLPTSLTCRVGGRICQAVTFVFVGCAGKQKATSQPSFASACEEDRVHRSSTKGQIRRGESGRPLLYAPQVGATSAKRAFVCGVHPRGLTMLYRRGYHSERSSASGSIGSEL
jgi:hypothetical protein